MLTPRPGTWAHTERQLVLLGVGVAVGAIVELCPKHMDQTTKQALIAAIYNKLTELLPEVADSIDTDTD